MNKKVGYLAYLPNMRLGQINTIYRRAYAVKKNNIPMDIYIITQQKNIDYLNKVIPDIGDYINIIGIPNLATKRLKRLWLVMKTINKIGNRYDVVFLRKIVFTPLAYLIFRTGKYKLLIEHHSKTLIEYLTNKQYLLWLIEKISYGLCSKYVKGIVSMNPETENYALELHKLSNDRSIVISNGILKKEISKDVPLSFDGLSLNILLIVSALVPWHGFDRVVAGLNTYSGNVKVKFHLVGDISTKELSRFTLKKDQVKLYGCLYGEQLQQVYSQVNMGIAPLALFRKQMTDNSPLKVREYMANGLPFILAYNDTDISKSLPYVKHYPPNNSPISINSIIDFLNELNRSGIENIAQSMKDFTKQKLLWSGKMQQYYNFAQKIVKLP